jgi:hypothetical protein
MPFEGLEDHRQTLVMKLGQILALLEKPEGQGKGEEHGKVACWRTSKNLQRLKYLLPSPDDRFPRLFVKWRRLTLESLLPAHAAPFVATLCQHCLALTFGAFLLPTMIPTLFFFLSN